MLAVFRTCNLIAAIQCCLIVTVSGLQREGRPTLCGELICPSSTIQFKRPTLSAVKTEPTPTLQHPTSPWAENRPPAPTESKGPEAFLANFYRHLMELVDFGQSVSLHRHDGSKSTELLHNSHHLHLKPSPVQASNDSLLSNRRLYRIADSLSDLLAEIVGLKARSFKVSSQITPTATRVEPPQTPFPMPKPGRMDAQARSRNVMRKFLRELVKNKMPRLKSLLLPGRVSINNKTILRHVVNGNVSKIADSALTFIKMFLDFSKSFPCPGACRRIEEMVAFCKQQHARCAPQQSPAILQPSPHSLDASEGLCPSGTKRCPFRRECESESSACIRDRDLFPEEGGRPSPTASKSVAGLFASKVPTGDHVQVANRSILGFLLKNVAKNTSSIQPDGIRKMYGELQYQFLGNTPRPTQNGHLEGRCAGMCSGENQTFCWSEMRCKRIGARCSPMHLAAMMNRSAFEDQSKCDAGFYCPVFANCTRNSDSCNPRRLIELPCDKVCLNATKGEGRTARQEDVDIFGLRCKEGHKYCPTKFGCISALESCESNPKLDVYLGRSRADEKQFFCRMRDFVCPRVFQAWIRLKENCSTKDGNDTVFAMNDSKKDLRWPRTTARSRPSHLPRESSHPSRPASLSKESRRPKTTQPLTSGPTEPAPTDATGRTLPFVTLKDYLPLRQQIRMLGRERFIVVASMPCRSSFQFKVFSRTHLMGTEVIIPRLTSRDLQVRGVVLPMDAVLKFKPAEGHFHGVCLIKYAVLSTSTPGPLQSVQVAYSQLSGSIALMVLPKHAKAEAILVNGKGPVEMNEDEKSPTCFKIGDKVRVERAVPVAGREIPMQIARQLDPRALEQYNTKLTEVNNTHVSAAIVSCTGHPWKLGTWKFRDRRSRMVPFPNECSMKRPFVIDLATCIAFYPRRDFSGKLQLEVAGAITSAILTKFHTIIGDEVVKINVNVKEQLDAPELSELDTCLPPLPFDLRRESNVGFEVDDVIRSGNNLCGNTGFKKASAGSLLENAGRFERRQVGLALARVSDCRQLGFWEYKMPGGSFQRVAIGNDGLALCLNASATIRFAPKNYSVLWDIHEAMRCAWVKAQAWTSLLHGESGPCNVSARASSSVSKGTVQLSVTRRGCDDVPGSRRQPDGCGRCGRKKISNVHCPCDGVPASGAVIDECGICSEGTTGRVFHKRDCARKCYANGTQSENVVDACGRCQKRKFANGVVVDCNGDCLYGKRRACINHCNVCVGGRTGKDINQGINSCGSCIGNVTLDCSKKLELTSENGINVASKFVIKVRATGFSSLRHLTCTLENSGGSPGGIIQVGKGFAKAVLKQRNSKLGTNDCEKPPVSEYHAHLAASVSNVGNYALKCKADGEGSNIAVHKGVLKVISSPSTVQAIFPPSIDSCSNGSFIIKGSGFQNSSSLFCGASCEQGCDFETKARFINESAIRCSIIVVSGKRNCRAQKVNLNVLRSSAVRPPAFSRSSPYLSVNCDHPKAESAAFSSGMRLILINLDKPASFEASGGKSKRLNCEALFDSETMERLGKSRCHLTYDRIVIYIAIGSNLISMANGSSLQLRLNRENLKCRKEEQHSVLKGRRLQEVTISLPETAIEAKISGRTSIGTCEKTTVNGIKSSGAAGGKLKYNWELSCKENGTFIVQAVARRSWFRIDGRKISDYNECIARLCVRNAFGQQSCKEHLINTIKNHNSTLMVRILGDQHRKIKAKQRYVFRPSARMSHCGGNGRKPTSVNFFWDIKGEDKITIKSYEGRNLFVKQGDLDPKKNYTLKVTVRAILGPTEVLTGESSIKVEVDGSQLKAKIRGGKKMTVGCRGKAVFDGRPSRDPDATSKTERFSWECTEENGGPCFKKSDPSKRLILEEKSLIEINADENLECNKSYVFKLTYSKGERQDTYETTVNMQPGNPAEVKLEQKRSKNKIIIIGFIKTKTAANATWSSIKEGYTKLDLADEKIVKEVGFGKIEVRRGRTTSRRYFLVIDTEYLPEGERYLIQLKVTNEDGESSAQIVVTTPSPPTKGEIIVEPANGTALNTSFTITAGEGWVQAKEGESRYEIGYIRETLDGEKEAVLREFTEQNFVDGIQLPPGSRLKNGTIKIYVKARNEDEMTTRATIPVVVMQPETISADDTKEMLDKADQAIKERDMATAIGLLTTMAETAKSVPMGAPGDFSINEDLTKQALVVLELASSEETRKATLTALESITLPAGETELRGQTRLEIGVKISTTFGTANPLSDSGPSRRRRRSISEQTNSQEEFTPITKEEVDSTMIIFDNIIDEQTPGSYQDDLKRNFTNTVPSLLRSLCAGTFTPGEYQVSKSNLSTLRANRLSGFAFNSIHMNTSKNNSGPRVLLGIHFKRLYESWNCSTSGLQCTEVCVASELYHYHMFPGEFQDRISDIVKIRLINPETYQIRDHEAIAPAVQFKMVLNEVPGSQYKVECKTWNSVGSNWTTDECVTLYGSGNEAICNCTELNAVAVFKSALPASTTLFPPASTSNSSSTQQQAYGRRDTSNSTTQQPSPPTTIGTKTATQLPIVVSFKFPVDYNAFKDKTNDLKRAIVAMLSTKLKISESRIVDLEIRAGSIIVTFTLLNNTDYKTESNIEDIKLLLSTMANNGTLSLVVDGQVLVVDGASLAFSKAITTKAPIPADKRDTSGSLIIIVAVVSSVFVVVVLILLIRCYVKNSHQRTKSDELAKSDLAFADDIKLQERDTSPELMGTDNQRFLDSPHQPISPVGGADAASPPGLPSRIVTPGLSGTPASNETGADARSTMVSVGIGSSASLKQSLFTA